MKRIIALLLAVFMLLSLVACGKEKAVEKEEYTTQDRYVFKGSSATINDVDTPAVQLDAQQVYDNLTYVPQMFYGYYRLVGGDAAREAYAADCTYTPRVVKQEERNLTTLPVGIRAGKNNMGHIICTIEGYNWMELYYMCRYDDDEPTLYTFHAAYTVEGDKLIVTPIKTYSYDADTKAISYSLSEESWEYTFGFRGRELTLTAGDQSITLTSVLDAYGEKDYVSAEGYISPGSKKIDNLERICTIQGDTNNAFVVSTPDDNNFESVAALESNGLMTMTIVTQDGDEITKTTHQFVYFCADKDGWVLTDGTDTYFYNLSYYDYLVGDASKYVDDEQSEQLEEIPEPELEDIVEKSENLLEDLAQAYEQAGLNVTVNRKTGEITLDTTVLFGVNETQVSDEGKAFLKQFIEVYTSVVFSETYEDFVSQIMVEGHTDPNGSYEYNLKLSQDRADSVKAYCLSDECGVQTQDLQTMLQAVGYAYDKPIYNDAGEVDMGASRRVSFRFLINLENP